MTGMEELQRRDAPRSAASFPSGGGGGGGGEVRGRDAHVMWKKLSSWRRFDPDLKGHPLKMNPGRVRKWVGRSKPSEIHGMKSATQF